MGYKKALSFCGKTQLIRKTKPSGNTPEASSEGIKIVVETFIFMFM